MESISTGKAISRESLREYAKPRAAATIFSKYGDCNFALLTVSGGYHVERTRNGRQNTTNSFHILADYGNDVWHGKGAYGTNTHIPGC